MTASWPSSTSEPVCSVNLCPLKAGKWHTLSWLVQRSCREFGPSSCFCWSNWCFSQSHQSPVWSESDPRCQRCLKPQTLTPLHRVFRLVLSFCVPVLSLYLYVVFHCFSRQRHHREDSQRKYSNDPANNEEKKLASNFQTFLVSDFFNSLY